MEVSDEEPHKVDRLRGDPRTCPGFNGHRRQRCHEGGKDHPSQFFNGHKDLLDYCQPKLETKLTNNIFPVNTVFMCYYSKHIIVYTPPLEKGGEGGFEFEKIPLNPPLPKGD